jgi:hypothetical protein
MKNIPNLEAFKLVPVKQIFKRKKSIKKEQNLHYYEILKRLGFISQKEYTVIEGMIKQKRIELNPHMMQKALKALVRKQLIKNVNADSNISQDKRKKSQKNVETFLTLLNA